MPVQADLTIGGRLQKVIMVANRNGFFYTLNRETGKLLVAKPFIDGSNWAKEIGADGRPIVLDNIGTPEKCLPDNHGGTNFQPPTFDPDTPAVLRHRARNLRDLGGAKADAADQHRRPRPERRPPAGRRQGAVGGAARDRSDDRRAALGAPLSVVSLDGLARPDRRPDVDRVRPRLHRRQRRLLLRVRRDDRERAVEVLRPAHRSGDRPRSPTCSMAGSTYSPPRDSPSSTSRLPR